MELYLHTADGGRARLPEPFRWRFSLGCGDGCDAFDLSCAYDPSQDGVLPRAARLSAFHEGRQVFFGPLDEWTAALGPDGWDTRLTGRGMQALLLDNQAEPAHFARAGWRDIAARYVTPFGVAAETADLPETADFQVASGASAWRAVTAYAADRAGRYPRFTPAGTLTVAPFATAKDVLDLSRLGLRVTCARNRYGVVSEALVRNRDTLQSYRIKNAAYPDEGRRLVMTGVGREGVAAMETSARLAMKQSLRGFVTVTAVLPWPFAAWPGDTLTLTALPAAFAENPYVVWEAETACAPGNGCETRLTLTPARYL
ncbi:MAG: hypothetical protein LBT60_07730 [Oscillospiraceae bacterium]|jgi:hypothetical protein|nr:hypothetical protein [Oscillospiraceae bacterium]